MRQINHQKLPLLSFDIMCRIGRTSSGKLPGCHSLQTPAGSTTACYHVVASCNPCHDAHITGIPVYICHPIARPSAAMCEDDSNSIRSWSELPVSVLTFAFEKVDVRYRMNCVALVCTSWAAAAAAATRSIELSRCTNTDSLQQWLRSRGSHVIKVKLQRSKGVITSLPCPSLRWLVLEDTSVDLRPGSQLLQDLCAATALEHLHLGDVVFPGDSGLVSLLLSPPAMHSVHLAYITELDSPKQSSTATAQDSKDFTHSLFWIN